MLVFIVSFLIAAQGVAVNKDRPYSEMPPHGTIYKKKLHGFFGTDPSNDVLGIYAIPENNTSKAEWHRFSLFDVSGPMFSARHHVGFDCIWFSFGPARMYQLKSGELDLFDNSTQNKVKPEDRAKRYREKYGPLDVQKEDRHSFALRSLFDKYLDNCVEIPGPSPLASLKDVAGFGSLPTSISSCKSFILTKKYKEFEIWDSAYSWDEKGNRWLTTPSERFQRISDWIADLDSDNFQKRAKAIEQLELLGRLAEPALEKFLASRPPLDARRRAEAVLEKLNSGISVAPKLGKEAYNYEKFTSLFVEDFYFFPRKNDYYFVTASGKLFYAKALASGQKFRKMKELWTDAKRPIVAVIEDADRDKVFLFAKDKTAGAKQDLFFELNPTLRPQPFDRSKLAPVNVEGRARTLLEYLPLIRNEAKK